MHIFSSYAVDECMDTQTKVNKNCWESAKKDIYVKKKKLILEEIMWALSKLK